MIIRQYKWQVLFDIFTVPENTFLIKHEHLLTWPYFGLGSAWVRIHQLIRRECFLFWFGSNLSLKPEKLPMQITLNNFVIFVILMFGSSQKSVKRKLLKDANFPSVYVYVYNVCMYRYVYKQVEADVPKLCRVHIGCLRPKINDASVVYWRLNM